MTVSEHFIAVDAVPSPKTAASLPNLMKRLMQRVKLSVIAYADYSTAAAMYEHLSGLSNAELQNGGSRATRLPGMSANPATGQPAAEPRR